MVTLVLQIIDKFFNEIFKNDVGFYFYATLITIITLIISYPAPILLDLQNSKIFGYLY